MTDLRRRAAASANSAASSNHASCASGVHVSRAITATCDLEHFRMRSRCSAVRLLYDAFAKPLSSAGQCRHSFTFASHEFAWKKVAHSCDSLPSIVVVQLLRPEGMPARSV